MAQTYNIGCQDCMKHLWVGQGSYDQPTGVIYSQPETFQFLLEHKGHSLVFDVSDRFDENEKYKEVEKDAVS